jgi:hypothetical protein
MKGFFLQHGEIKSGKNRDAHGNFELVQQKRHHGTKVLRFLAEFFFHQVQDLLQLTQGQLFVFNEK